MLMLMTMMCHSNIQLRDYQQLLFENCYKAFKKGYHSPLIVAPCGAGKTFIFMKMLETASQKGEVLILVHRKELLEQHYELIGDMPNVRLAMVMTEAKHLNEHSKPNLIIIDEAHLAMAESYRKVTDYYGSSIIGFTATPVRLDGKPLGDLFDCLIEGVSVKWLIEHKRLAPYEYYAPTLVDVSALKKQMGDYSVGDVEPLVMDRAIYGDVIKHYRKFASGKKTIAYCVSIAHSQRVAEIFNEAGIKAVHFDSNTPKAERKQIMQDFRDGKIQVLCNCMLIVEGISIDDCECCLLLRPTDSLALFIQSAMRCMRYREGKTAVIIDYVGNYTRHGLPDDDREWNLCREVEHKPRYNEKGEFLIRECPNCYKVFKTAVRCPYCGYEYPVTSKEIEQIKEIELKRITQAEREAEAKRKKQKRQEVGMAKTRRELERIAKERGYKPGWVWQQMRIKGIYK